MGGSKKRTVGYRYYVGLHMALAHGPIDKVTAIKVEEKLVWTGDVSSGDITIDKHTLFGGENKGGGVGGTLTIAAGGPAQTADSYLVSKIGGLVPAYRGIVAAILKSMYIGTSPYLKVWEFLCQRVHTVQDGATQWQDAISAIPVTLYDSNGDPWTIQQINPVHIIRECLTNSKWGMGYTSADIDEANFLAAAQALYDEGMGMCIVWDTQRSIEDFIKLVLQHIGADIFIDRETGLYNLKLIRYDYDPNTLLVLDPSNVDKVEDVRRPAFGELCNSITITYHNVIYNKNASLSIQDIASVQEQGAEVNSPITYEGFVDPDVVARVGERDMNALGTPLISCTVYATKVARSLKQGDCFKLTWPDALMEESIMRVTEIAYGNGKSKRVRIKCIQDAYAYPTQSLVIHSESEWSDPVTEADNPIHQLAFEAPYFTLVNASNSGTVNSSLAEDPSISYVAAAASRPSGLATNGGLYTNPGPEYDYAQDLDFCASGELSADVGLMDTTITIMNEQDLDLVELNTWLQIDSELMGVVSIAGTTITVKRGVLDTLPQTHLANAPVIFWDGFESIDPTEYTESDVVDVKIVTENGSGTSDIDLADEMTVTLTGRAYRPFLPGQIKFDSLYYPAPSVEFDSDITMTWAHRNRKLQTGGTLIGFVDGGITVEAGTTYEVRLYNSSDVLQHTYSGITGTSCVIFTSDFAEVADGILRIQLDSVRDETYSWMTYQWDLTIPLSEAAEGGLGIETEDNEPLNLE